MTDRAVLSEKHSDTFRVWLVGAGPISQVSGPRPGPGERNADCDADRHDGGDRDQEKRPVHVPSPVRMMYDPASARYGYRTIPRL